MTGIYNLFSLHSGGSCLAEIEDIEVSLVKAIDSELSPFQGRPHIVQIDGQ